MSDSKERVLVTGGAGFIGSHLCDALLERGCSVVCLDNLSTGAKANISNALENSAFTLEQGDVCDPFDYDVDLVFHLASPASPVDYYGMQVETLRANSLGTLNCLELVRGRGARLILASTSEIYGDPQISPQKEDYFGNVNPVGPRSCYDEGKRFAEAICKAYEREHKIEVVIARIFNTYGPRMRSNDGRVIPNFVLQALSGEPMTVYGDGNQTRSFCYVSDMVGGLIRTMLTPGADGEVINLGNPNEMRIIDLAARVKQKLNSHSELQFEPLPVDDPLRRKPDIAKAMDILSWAPKVQLEEGLDDVISWFEGRVKRG